MCSYPKEQQFPQTDRIPNHKNQNNWIKGKRPDRESPDSDSILMFHSITQIGEVWSHPSLANLSASVLASLYACITATQLTPNRSLSILFNSGNSLTGLFCLLLTHPIASMESPSIMIS